MKILPRNVWILAVCQALMMSCASMVILVAGLVGNSLSTVKELATLPVTAMIVGTATATVPIVLLMNRFGRKVVFIAIAFFAGIATLCAAYSIEIKSFYGFTFSTFMLGMSLVAVQQFRFAAMESVAPELMAKAAARVLLGGIVAAYIGPEIAILGKSYGDQQYSGSFLLLLTVYILAILLLLFGYQDRNYQHESKTTAGRSLSVIIKQPVLWVAVLAATVGYAVMSFIMTATPISMHVFDGHSLQDAKWVIQSHIIAMFLPSLVTPWLIKKLGMAWMMIIGSVLLAACVGIAYSHQQVMHYWGALLILGVGWNFLFVSGTALLPQAYTGNEKFRTQAFNDFFVFSAQAIASISAGWLIYQVGWQAMLLLCMPLLLLLILIIIYWKLVN